MKREVSVGSRVMERGHQKGPVGRVIGVYADGVQVQWSDGRVTAAAVDELIVVQPSEGEC